MARLFFLACQISLNIVLQAAKNFLPYFFLYKDHIIYVNFQYFIHKCLINSLVVHPKFDTGAAENLWRAALWPHLKYNIIWRGGQKSAKKRYVFYECFVKLCDTDEVQSNTEVYSSFLSIFVNPVS